MKIKSIQVELDNLGTITKKSKFSSTKITEEEIRNLDIFWNGISDKAVALKKIKPSGKKVGIFFSGGYDSTTLVIKNLEAGNKVYPLDVVFNDISESFTKRIVLYQLKLVYGNELLHDLITIADYRKMAIYNFETTGYTLQPYCAFSVAFIDEFLMKELNEIQFGFAIGDAAISFLDEFINIYKNTVRFKLYDFEVPPITFPLKQSHHVQNIHYITNWEANNTFTLPCSSCDQHLKFWINKSGDKNNIKYRIEDCHSCPKCKNEYNEHNVYIITIKGSK